MQTLWNDHLGRPMPASLINDQHNLFVPANTLSGSKLNQYPAPYICCDAWQQQPERPATVWMHEAVQIEPFVAMLHHNNGPLPLLAPDTAQDRFEPNPMLIFAPDFNRCISMLSLNVG